MQRNTPTLLITPDPEWPAMLYSHLLQNGFAPLTIAPNGSSALELCRLVSPQLVLIDLHLFTPTLINGVIDLCAEILVVAPNARIVLAVDSETDIPLRAFYAGVSGYIERDFSVAAWSSLLHYVMQGGVLFGRSDIEQMLADIRAGQTRQPLVTIGPLHIDLARRQVLYGWRRVQLTPREFDLLTFLAQKPDRVVSFDELLNEAWGYAADDGAPAQVRLYIARLRRKLTDEARAPNFILTERGVGYRLHSGVLHRAEASLARQLPTTNGAPFPPPPVGRPHRSPVSEGDPPRHVGQPNGRWITHFNGQIER